MEHFEVNVKESAFHETNVLFIYKDRYILEIYANVLPTIMAGIINY